MMFSAVKAWKMLSKWCTGFLAYMMSKVELGLDINEMPFIQEFSNIFLKELLRLTLKQKVEFVIELAPNIIPILKVPYRMAPIELHKLKKQL